MNRLTTTLREQQPEAEKPAAAIAAVSLRRRPY
jgi:hypothetical protein